MSSEEEYKRLLDKGKNILLNNSPCGSSILLRLNDVQKYSFKGYESSYRTEPGFNEICLALALYSERCVGWQDEVKICGKRVIDV